MKKFNLMATGILVATLLIPTVASAKNVTVKSGDTLYRLAVNNKVSVSQIKSLNKLKNDNIYVGQVLKVSNEETINYLTLTKTSGLYKTQNGEYIIAVKPVRVVILETGTNGWYKVQTWLGPLWTKNGVLNTENQKEYFYLTKTSSLYK
jgi:LysM repeat protein